MALTGMLVEPFQGLVYPVLGSWSVGTILKLGGRRAGLTEKKERFHPLLFSPVPDLRSFFKREGELVGFGKHHLKIA